MPSPHDDGAIDQWQAVLPPHVRTALLKFYSEAELDALSVSLARPPRSSCVRANTRVAPAEQLAQQVAEELRKVEGCEWLVTDAESSESGTVSVHPTIPDAIMITPPPRAPLVISDFHETRELLVSRRCAESVLRGANVFIPGIMGCSPHAAKGETVVVICDVHDRFLRGSSTHILRTRKLDPKRMKGSAGKEAARKAGVDGAGIRTDNGRLEDGVEGARLPEGIVVIGRGVMQEDRREVFGKRTGVGCLMTECVYAAPPLNNLLAGSIYIQNLPSIVVAHALAPRPDDVCLDMCAAPGGKSTHIATLIAGGKGTVLALDRSHSKVEVIKKWASDLGLTNLTAVKADATLLLPRPLGAIDLGAIEAVGAIGAVGASGGGPDAGKEKEAGKAPAFTLEEESFDRICLDPPCTALGLRPRLAIDIGGADMLRTAHYQRRMLHVAAGLLKVGGRMTYSTCTINPEENEGNVAYALAHLPLRLLPALPAIAPGGRPGAGLSEEHCALIQRFDPGGPLDTNGFFLALFEKTGPYVPAPPVA